MSATNDTNRRTSAIKAEQAEAAAIYARRKSSAAAQAISKAMADPVTTLDADQLSDADKRLAEMGYVQVYKREFSWLSCISFAFSISGLFASVTTTYVYPLEAGGLPSAVWCWLISGAGCMCITMSVSELVSAYPTSGGLYFTCKYLAPDAWVPEISWVCGWFNILGQTAGLASTEYGCAQLLLAAISMASNFSYLPTDRQTVGVMAANTVFHTILNSFNTAFLEKITRSYVWINVVPDAGWSPPGWSFLFGFLSASWTMTDYDATAHIAEEIKNPELKAPWAITIALGFTYVAGWLFTIVLSYCSPNPSDLLSSPVYQPVAQLFYNVMGREVGTLFTVFAFIVLSFTGMTGLQAGARTLWALSRDELLPLSNIWSRINPYTQTPIYSVWLLSIISILITLIGLGSYTAVAAIFNVTAIALDWSYCIPILCNMFTRKLQLNADQGPYRLGKWSWWINLYAVVWTSFVTVIFLFPTVRPVTKENMNYAVVILAGIGAFAAGYWFLGGRKYYIGPRVRATIVDGAGGSAVGLVGVGVEREVVEKEYGDRAESGSE